MRLVSVCLVSVCLVSVCLVSVCLVSVRPVSVCPVSMCGACVFARVYVCTSISYPNTFVLTPTCLRDMPSMCKCVSTHPAIHSLITPATI